VIPVRNIRRDARCETARCHAIPRARDTLKSTVSTSTTYRIGLMVQRREPVRIAVPGKTLITTALALLLAGAAMNAVTAWALAVWPLPTTVDFERSRIKKNDAEPLPQDWIDAWVRRAPHSFPDEPVFIVVHERFAFRRHTLINHDPAQRNAPQWQVHIYEAGFPFRSMCGTRSIYYQLDDVPFSIVPDDYLVPLEPLPAAFIANTLVYTGALAVLLLLFRWTRTSIRLRRGRCPRCKYPLTESGTCPECGTSTGGRRWHPGSWS
jgi:hypothetical protein